MERIAQDVVNKERRSKGLRTQCNHQFIRFYSIQLVEFPARYYIL